jgi:hypothetical protein
MRTKFCCDASRHLYEDYYVSQSGHGMPMFEGYRGQRGHGLGSVLSGFFRSAFPIIKRGLAFLGKHVLRTGADIASDVADGQPFRDAAKKRVSERINEVAPGLIPQSGSGRRRRRTYVRKQHGSKRKHSKKRSHGKRRRLNNNILFN